MRVITGDFDNGGDGDGNNNHGDVNDGGDGDDGNDDRDDGNDGGNSKDDGDGCKVNHMIFNDIEITQQKIGYYQYQHIRSVLVLELRA